MNIRPVEVFELPALVQGGHEFFADSKAPGGAFEPDYFCQSWGRLMTEGRGRIFGLYQDDGMIIGALAAVIGPDPNVPIIVATECFWFVRSPWRGKGIKLLDAFEAWADERGAHLKAMIHLVELQPEKLMNLYVHRGYREFERHFIKEGKCR